MSTTAVVVAAALALVALVPTAAWVLALVVEPYRRQRHIWGFTAWSGEQPKIIIEAIPGEQTGLYQRPSAGFGAVTAVARLTYALNASRRGLAHRVTRALGQPVDIYFSDDPKTEELCDHHDIVVVGGPKSNQITAEALRTFGSQPSSNVTLSDEELVGRTGDRRRSNEFASGLGVATKKNTIFWFGEPYVGDVKNTRQEADLGGDPPNDDDATASGASGYEGHDYGVVLRLPSIHETGGAERRMVVVFGSQTFGVGAASSWLVNVRSRSAGRRARRMMARHRNVAVLVRSQVVGGEVREPELVDIVALPDPLARWYARPDDG